MLGALQISSQALDRSQSLLRFSKTKQTDRSRDIFTFFLTPLKH